MPKQVLILASVASMIDQFNMPNIKLLKQMGYEVHVACNFVEGNTCSDEQITILISNLLKLNVQSHQIDFKRNVLRLADNIKAYKQVYKLINDSNYKFIHCHSPIGGVVGRLVGKATKTKVIYTAHGFHFYKGAPFKNWLIYYSVEKWLSRYTDVLITINNEDYNRAKVFKAKKLKYVHGVGIDTNKVGNIKVNKLEKRKSIDLKEDDFLILSVGELNNNKNHEVIIKAISYLKNEKIKYVLCGQGILESKLIKLTQELGIEHQVKFMGFRNDILELMNISDLYAFPSFREGLSVSLMEAMASGLPVVCSKIRGNIDLIEGNKGGYLLEPTNYIRMSKKIKNLYDDIELRESLANHNRSYIKKYSIINVMNELSQIYKEM